MMATSFVFAYGFFAAGPLHAPILWALSTGLTN